MINRIALLLGGLLFIFVSVTASANGQAMSRRNDVRDAEAIVELHGNSWNNAQCDALPADVSQRTKRLCNAFINFGCVDNPSSRRCNYIGRAYERSWRGAEPIYPWIVEGPVITEITFNFSLSIASEGGFDIYCVNLATGASRQELGGVCAEDEAAIEMTAFSGVYVNIYGPEGYLGSDDSSVLESEIFPEIDSSDLEGFTYDQDFLVLTFDAQLAPEVAVRSTSNGASLCKYQVQIGALAGGAHTIDLTGSCYHP